ncbi:30S ribosomal protein S4 [Candidatus Woesearchaeota archaeon]|nr:30S ribosomal protein S4 [Candidatus Woesearchaeota archaeon]|tara:strand:+ start:11984 stop:12526 length:543 start_codon:yes stop_codon:yes gene_type:complete
MGSPRFPKKKYSRPLKLWNKERLDEESPFMKEFGLKNKQEYWRTTSLLRKFTAQAKRLIALRGEQAEIEKKQLLDKLVSLGVITKEASLDEVLGLTVKDFLVRRLQTVVFKKKFSHSISQSRQFISHRHIKIGDKIITSPSYLVPLVLEEQVTFVENSALSKPDHPERVIKEVTEVPDAE